MTSAELVTVLFFVEVKVIELLEIRVGVNSEDALADDVVADVVVVSVAASVSESEAGAKLTGSE